METLLETSLTQTDKCEAAHLLTEAFWDNPAHCFIYPDATTRFGNLYSNALWTVLWSVPSKSLSRANCLLWTTLDGRPIHYTRSRESQRKSLFSIRPASGTYPYGNKILLRHIWRHPTVLYKAHIDPSAYPASLTTQKYENVRFYQRLGFEVRDDRPISDGRKRFQNWIMVREAGPR